ncbi:MAG: prolyl oligopeptidase family serine peptidase [Rubrivivax sp.]
MHASEDPDDPFQWLEDVHGERAMAWVRERNDHARAALDNGPGFAVLRDELRAVLDSADQIPYVTRRGPWLYNLWRDAQQPRGLWRRCTLDEYRKPAPLWHTLIDLDALARAEGENWVWAGAHGLGPAYEHWLISLSRGGADATVVREFDSTRLAFVEGGFALPEAKSDISWIDAHNVYVGTDFGPGSLTDSGYPRVIRHWQRGQPLASAAPVFEAEPQDIAAYASVDPTPGFERTVLGRALDMYRSRSVLWVDGRAVPIDKPDDASLSFWRAQVLIHLRSDWTVQGHTWPSGALLVADADSYLRGERVLQALFTPTTERSLTDFSTTRTHVLLNVLDNVASRLEEWHWLEDHWHRREVAAPFPGTLSVASWHDPWLGDDALAESYALNSSDFLSPDALLLGHTGTDARELLKSRPSFFDSDGMRAEQHFAHSGDGTRVPYFVIGREDALADGRRPTLLSAYGGFEVSNTPTYSGALGVAWLRQGGTFVLANIRGGGEYGPRWHQAALREHRQRCFDDLAAVAEDLIARRITSAQRLAIQGGSNGGLLVGAVMLQRPELFRCVVCQVPLLDMRRYHRLLAGASWMAEYGDPDLPDDWAFIGRYSPYQNVRAGTALPTVLFTTSTRDDRVHPGHARKLAARMLQQQHAVLYYENIEGGHGGAADNAQRADMLALEFSFLWQQLGTPPAHK